MYTGENLTRQKTPSIPYEKIAKKVLGSRFDLSLVFIGNTRSENLNLKYRGIKKPTNVLTFPIDKDLGEIYINLRLAKHEAKIRGLKQDAYIAYLFIHGLLHLKGYKHGSTMENKEDSILSEFGFIS